MIEPAGSTTTIEQIYKPSDSFLLIPGHPLSEYCPGERTLSSIKKKGGKYVTTVHHNATGIQNELSLIVSKENETDIVSFCLNGVDDSEIKKSSKTKFEVNLNNLQTSPNFKILIKR